MSRSGYSNDLDYGALARWRGAVSRAICGRRGQDFLKELAIEMDRMPEKILIESDLINEDGDCCTIGVVCKSRGIDVSNIDPEEAREVGKAVNIARAMAAEIEYENDEGWYGTETPEKRWARMRSWVSKNTL